VDEQNQAFTSDCAEYHNLLKKSREYATLKAENERLRAALNVTREALLSALNLETHVTKAEQHIPACKGLDVEYHFGLIRAAISVATPFEAQN